jgi:hypothetical protein
MREMVGDQTANQAAKLLKKGEKKVTSSEQQNYQLSCCYSFSIQSCLCVS